MEVLVLLFFISLGIQEEIDKEKMETQQKALINDCLKENDKEFCREKLALFSEVQSNYNYQKRQNEAVFYNNIGENIKNSYTPPPVKPVDYNKIYEHVLKPKTKCITKPGLFDTIETICD